MFSETVEIESMTFEDATEAITALGKLSNVTYRVNSLVEACQELLNSVVMNVNVDVKANVEIDIKHAVRVSCTDPKMINVSNVAMRIRYSLSGSTMIAVAAPNIMLYALPWVDFKKVKLRDIIILAIYEKLEGLVSRLVDEVRKVSKEDARKLEELRTVVNVVKDLIVVPT